MMQLLEGEVCKHDPTWPLYNITNYGRVWSTITNKFLSPCKERNYHKVSLKDATGKRRMRHVHILVGRLYLPDYKEGMNILHIDETLAPEYRHRVANLRCGTQAQNIKEMYDKGRRVGKPFGRGLALMNINSA